MMPLAILHRLRCLIKSQAVCIAILFLIMPLMSSSSVYAESDLKTSRVLFVTSKKTAIYTQVVDLVKGNLRNQQDTSYQFTVVLGKSFADAQINLNLCLVACTRDLLCLQFEAGEFSQVLDMVFLCYS